MGTGRWTKLSMNAISTKTHIGDCQVNTEKCVVVYMNVGTVIAEVGRQCGLLQLDTHEQTLAQPATQVR